MIFSKTSVESTIERYYHIIIVMDDGHKINLGSYPLSDQYALPHQTYVEFACNNLPAELILKIHRKYGFVGCDWLHNLFLTFDLPPAPPPLERSYTVNIKMEDGHTVNVGTFGISKANAPDQPSTYAEFSCQSIPHEIAYKILQHQGIQCIPTHEMLHSVLELIAARQSASDFIPPQKYLYFTSIEMEDGAIVPIGELQISSMYAADADTAIFACTNIPHEVAVEILKQKNIDCKPTHDALHSLFELIRRNR